MILITGSFLWVLSLLAVVRLLCIPHESFLSSRGRYWFWGVLIVLSMVLLFRPHEDIFGGEDPGSYVNSGITYGRQQSFFSVDPLLCQVPPDVRTLFYYGDSGYGTTKDACLWVRDSDKAVIGPHFQPAYPLLISIVSVIGGAPLALYVIPLFTLFTAIALRCLALQCLRHRWAGKIVFLLYLLNPLTSWHGRCARPEIIAAFMFFGGCALLIHAWQNQRWSYWLDILLGTLCVSFSPFFHITAWLLVIPATVTAIMVILHGRDDFLLYPAAALAVLMAFVYQTKAVTDYYIIERFFDIALRSSVLISVIIVTCFLALCGVCFLSKRLRTRRGSHGKTHPVGSKTSNATAAPSVRTSNGAQTVPLAFSISLALATALFFIFSYVTRDAVGSLPVLGRPVQNYLYITDFRAFMNMISRPMALLTLAGWIAWLTGRQLERRTRIIFAMITLPGIMLAGNIHNFMMTRYLHVTIIPISALSLTALVTLLPDRRWYSALSISLAIAISVLGLHHRTHLITLTEHKGLARFLKPFAKIMTQDRGILLGEYSRLAAPFEHFFGIPCLGLDNEQRDDYTKAEQAWETIMRNHPYQPAFFMTPFQTPLSDRFRFTPVYSAVFHDRKLQQAYQYLPTRIREGPLPMALYRMTLKTHHPKQPSPFKYPYVVPFDVGNMGLRRFANLRVKTWSIQGIMLSPDHETRFEVPALSDNQTVQSLLLLIMTDFPNPSPPVISPSLTHEKTGKQFLHLADNWWLLRIKGSQLTAHQSFYITALSPMFLADMIVMTDRRAFSIFKQFPQDKLTRKEMVPFKARWSRADAQVLLPVPPENKGLLLMMINPPEVRADGLTDFTIGKEPVFSATADLPEARPAITREIQTEQWQWQAWPFRITDPMNDTIWITLHTEPAWDSKTRGFPSDLGTLIGYVIVLPSF